MRKIITLVITAGLAAILLTGCADRLQQRGGNNEASAANTVQQTPNASGTGKTQPSQSAGGNSAAASSQTSALDDVTASLNSMNGVISGMDKANSQDLSIPTP